MFRTVIRKCVLRENLVQLVHRVSREIPDPKDLKETLGFLVSRGHRVPGESKARREINVRDVEISMMSEEPLEERGAERMGQEISAPGIFVTPAVQTVSENKTARFTCYSRGYNTAVVKWRRLGKLLPKDRTILGETGVLKIKRVTFMDSGLYMCTVNSPSGIAQATVMLRVQGKYGLKNSFIHPVVQKVDSVIH